MYIPTPPPPPSREVGELAEYLTQVIEAYQKDHPEMTAPEVLQALRLSAPTQPGLAARALAIGLVGMLSVVGVAFYSVSRTGGEIPWMVITVAGLVVVVGVLAVVRSA